MHNLRNQGQWPLAQLHTASHVPTKYTDPIMNKRIQGFKMKMLEVCIILHHSNHTFFWTIVYACWQESLCEINTVDMHYSHDTLAFDMHLTESTGSIPLHWESKSKWQQFVLEILTSDEVTISVISPNGLVLYLWLYTLDTGGLVYVFISCRNIILVSFF